MNNAIIHFPSPGKNITIRMSVIVFLALVSCTLKEPTNEIFRGGSIDYSEERISKLSPRDIETYIEEKEGDPRTKNSVYYRIDPIISNCDTILYLVNYRDGWELISGDLRTEPVLMHCERGNIGFEDLYSNPARSAVVSGITCYLDSLVSHPVKIDASVQTKGNPVPPSAFMDSNGRYWVLAYRYLAHSATQIQEPLTGLKWGPGSLTSTSSYNWNVSMPYRSSSMTYHCTAGCGPVAAAQTIVYLSRKNGIPASYYASGSCSAYVQNNTIYLNDDNTSFSNLNSDWSLLPSERYGSSATMFGAASSLMLLVGKYSHTGYSNEDAGCSMVDLRTALDSFGYDCSMSSSYTNVFRNQIYVNKLPIIAGIDAQRVENGTTSDFSHFVLVEGYKKKVDAYTYVYKNGDTGVFEYQYRQYTFTYESVAVNWGYDGDGEYNGSDVVWNNLSSVLTRTFSGGNDIGTITCMLYNFTAKQV